MAMLGAFGLFLPPSSEQRKSVAIALLFSPFLPPVRGSVSLQIYQLLAEISSFFFFPPYQKGGGGTPSPPFSPPLPSFESRRRCTCPHPHTPPFLLQRIRSCGLPAVPFFHQYTSRLFSFLPLREGDSDNAAPFFRLVGVCWLSGYGKRSPFFFFRS